MNIINNSIYKKQIETVAKAISDTDFSVLITGASGQIGSTLVDVFLTASVQFEKRIKVFALGRDEDKLRNRFSYADTKYISYIVQDVMNPLNVDNEIRYIIHTASNTDPIAYSKYPVETMLTNLIGVHNALEYCKNHKNTRFLLTSTFEVYGRIEGKDIYKEEDSGEIDLNSIRSSYPESKKCAEILSRCYRKEYDIEYVIARLCSIYGPTMLNSDSKAHAQFIRNGLAGKDVILKSKGEQRRSYCYLFDAIVGILTVLFKGKSGEAYNVSNEKAIVSIAEFAKKVAMLCKVNVTYGYADRVEQDGYSRPQNCILDNSKLKSLGWVCKYMIEEGLQNTIDIMRTMYMY